MRGLRFNLHADVQPKLTYKQATAKDKSLCSNLLAISNFVAGNSFAVYEFQIEELSYDADVKFELTEEAPMVEPSFYLHSIVNYVRLDKRIKLKLVEFMSNNTLCEMKEVDGKPKWTSSKVELKPDDYRGRAVFEAINVDSRPKCTVLFNKFKMKVNFCS